MVDNLCATINEVLPFNKVWVASWMTCSASLSIDEVASSKINILGSAKIALAKLINCFSPIDSLLPPSPISD